MLLPVTGASGIRGRRADVARLDLALSMSRAWVKLAAELTPRWSRVDFPEVPRARPSQGPFANFLTLRATRRL